MHAGAQADWLDKKNTIFGKVVGDTVYNLLRFNEVAVSDSLWLCPQSPAM